MGEPYLKLYKKLLKWEWYDDINTKVLFLHCLLRANWESGSWHGIDYNAGQFITSLQTLAVETHLTVKQVRVALRHLKETNEVADQRQGNCRIITVIKWNEYQSNGKPTGKPRAMQGQTEGKLGATDKEYKEYKNNNKYYDDPELDKAFSDYAEMRKLIKKPLSDRAVELAKGKLEKLSCGDKQTSIAILNQSIEHSWQGLFELKKEGNFFAQKVNKFSNFEGRKYNFDELEEEGFT